MTKIRVGLVFGGRSGEHEVSVRSATSIYHALDKTKYNVELLGVDKRGLWHRIDQKWLPQSGEMKSLPGGDKSMVIQDGEVDVFFPIIHGTYGEDGSLQGLFELLNVAYVGAGVLGSAVGMDKDIMKRLWIQAGLPVGKYWVVRKTSERGDLDIPEYPVFVKPANMGSSVGISKVNDKKEISDALRLAFQYDEKVLIEENIIGRELEISVLGNENPIASVPGEVKSTHAFYDYEAKYIDENGAELEIPAKMPEDKVKEMQKLAIRAFKVLECSGMARMDMFLTREGKFVLNEINTLPGFTSISMYPKLWEASGLAYSELLDKLIELAIEKKKQKDELKRSYG